MVSNPRIQMGCLCEAIGPLLPVEFGVLINFQEGPTVTLARGQLVCITSWLPSVHNT